jgi:hypothetical protein
MELDLQSLFGIDMHSSTHWLRPRNPHPPPSPAFWPIYEGAIGQPRQTTSLCDSLGQPKRMPSLTVQAETETKASRHKRFQDCRYLIKLESRGGMLGSEVNCVCCDQGAVVLFIE